MADFVAVFRPVYGHQYVAHDPEDYAAVFTPRISDGTPPTIEIISPAPDTVVARDVHLVFRLKDNQGFALRELWLGFGREPAAYEFVHDGVKFRGNYAAASDLTVEPGGSLLFDVARAGGFPGGSVIRLRASVVDVGGNLVVVYA